LVLLVNDSEYSKSTGAKSILYRGCIYLVWRALLLLWRLRILAAAAARHHPTPPPLFFLGGGGGLLRSCYLGNQFFCIVNLRPEM
jgi:hypothetical protein